LYLGLDLELAIGASILVRLAGSAARGWRQLPALGTFDAGSVVLTELSGLAIWGPGKAAGV